MRSSARSGMAWQLEPESAAAAVAVLEADATLHHLDQPLANGEPEAGAAFLARGGRVGLGESAEDARSERLRDAGTTVVYRNPQAFRSRIFGRFTQADS